MGPEGYRKWGPLSASPYARGCVLRLHSGQHRYRLGDGLYVIQPTALTLNLSDKRKLIPVDRPVPLLWKVQINKNTKLSIIGLMGLGILFVEPSLYPFKIARRSS